MSDRRGQYQAKARELGVREAYRVTLLELRDLVIVPAMEAVRLDADCPHVARWVADA
jgi:hypothetical protein